MPAVCLPMSFLSNIQFLKHFTQEMAGQRNGKSPAKAGLFRAGLTAYSTAGTQLFAARRMHRR